MFKWHKVWMPCIVLDMSHTCTVSLLTCVHIYDILKFLIFLFLCSGKSTCPSGPVKSYNNNNSNNNNN